MIFSVLKLQLLFLFANEVEDRHHFCIGFAFTIHYAFLASVFWMNCMSHIQEVCMIFSVLKFCLSGDLKGK
jgi:uncharacterized protein YcsI (UPF0317 family)